MNYDLNSIDPLMQEAVEHGIFPGAVLLVAAQGEVIFHQAYGMADLFSRRPMTTDTIFDLASLTKPLVTTLAVMLLVQRGRMELDRPCSDYWPEFSAGDKKQITVRHLLSHCSGLPAWRPYYLRLRRFPQAKRIRTLQEWIVREPLLADPGERSEYSDIGFMVLQWLVERVGGRRLDHFFDADILHLLNLADLFFIGLDRPKPDRLYAATELCPWRNRLLVGEVHDDNAHVIGGVAGHAGLFGSAGAVSSLLQVLLSADQGHCVHALFDRSLLKAFFKRQAESTWALGFDTPAEKDSSAGRYFRTGSVGHLGYTGTSFWMDRGAGIIVLLLTNRVHPSRFDTRIREFRPRLHDVIMGAVVLA